MSAAALYAQGSKIRYCLHPEKRKAICYEHKYEYRVIEVRCAPRPVEPHGYAFRTGGHQPKQWQEEQDVKESGNCHDL